jgi:hypothetical protein
VKKALLSFLAFAIAASAGTRIHDTVLYANGTRADGYIRIDWPAFTTGSGAAVAGGTMTVKLTAGALDIELQPTDAATPSGTVYTVRMYLRNSPAAVEYWSVPSSLTPVGLRGVRMAPQSAIGNLQLAVANLDATSLQGRPVTSAAPANGQTLQWNAAANRWDLNGSALRLTSTTPSDGQMLRWNGAAQTWDLVNLVDAASLTGTADGTNLVFLLPAAPVPASSLILFRNGLALQAGGFDYTLSGSTVTFIAGEAPQPGDTLRAWFRY